MYTSIGLVFFTCLLRINAQEEPLNFTAMVNEYHTTDSIENNLNYHEFLIMETGHFTGQIVVFPEGALTHSTNDAVVVPDPKLGVRPYRNGAFNGNNVMARISEAAARTKVYTVINVFEKVQCKSPSNCPDRGYFLYNTNVAFDRRGAVIARYRKYNVLPGNEVDKPDKPELSTFTTDFGVTFGLFTGSDILFKTPAVDLVREKNVKHIAFPSRLPGEFPFLTGIQVQDGWSYAMNVSVLASGVNDIQNGCSGTGIYVARKHKTSRMYDKSGTNFLFWGVPKKNIQTPFIHDGGDQRVLNLREDPTIPQSSGKDLDVNEKKFQDKICHGSFCCNFDLKYLKNSDDRKHKYRAVVFQGMRQFQGSVKQEVAYCGVVLCTDGNCAKRPEDGNYPLLFENIKINAYVKKANTLQFPSTLVHVNDPAGARNLDTMYYDKYTFEKQDVAGTNMANVILKAGQVKGLVTFGIFGRQFD